MTDRELLELLELAAKAAGLNFSWNDRLECGEVWQDGDRIKRFWQPHRDDGDALRLAVAIGMSVHTARPGSKDTTVAVEWVPPVKEGDGVWVDEPIGSDRNHDTRRAIVRAAAEIGRQMQ